MSDAALAAHFAPQPGTVYLDAATYGLPPRATVEAMQRALGDWQAGRADWVSAWDRAGETCRARFGTLIGAPAETVALMPSVSVGVGVVASSLQSGDEVLVPDDEFTSVLFPFLEGERARGLRVRVVPFERLADAVTTNTRLVAFSLVQSQSGHTADLAGIVAAAGAAGARTLVDATHGVPFVEVAPHLGGVDYLVCAAYKHLLCPRGVAFLYVAPRRWDDTPSLAASWRGARNPYGHYYGGPLDLAPNAARFDVSLAWFSWVGAAESLDLLTRWRAEGALEGPRRLARRLAERLGVEDQQSTVVSVSLPDAEALRSALHEAGIRAAVRASGVRFAPHVYNSQADVDRAADVVVRHRLAERPAVGASTGR